MQHEVRLRAAAWARRLVDQHGDRAESVVVATLKRRDLTRHEKIAARTTRDALRDYRRLRGYADPYRPVRLRTRIAWLMLLGPLWSYPPAGGRLSRH